MLFNSLEFALFFPVVCALYFLVPRKLKTPLLLVHVARVLRLQRRWQPG